MALANRDPRRGEDLRLPLTHVCPDDDTAQVLAEQGFTLGSVVPAGREVVMSRIAHSWAGAGVTDVTDQVHPAVAAQCVRAVRVIGLDVAGLDIVTQDIARPLEQQGGAIVEVNAEPTIAFHFPPLCDTYRPVCEAIIDSLFPDGQTGRIPLAVVSGSGPRARVGRLLAGLLSADGHAAGRASSEGLFLRDDLVKQGDQGRLAGSLTALLLPECDVAVLERDLGGLREEGLGIDRIDVALLTRPNDPSEPGLDAEHARAAGFLVAAAAPHGAVVIDADDRTALGLVASFAGTVILVGSDDAGVARSRGERAHVFVRDSRVVFVSRDGTEQAVASGEGAKIADDARSGWLLAAAAAWALGVSAETMATRLPSLLLDG
jgi:cyanophycin synthetase